MSRWVSGGKLAFAIAAAIGTAAPAWAHGITERVSIGPGGVQANDFSYIPAISADGRFVAFHSVASNLVPGDTNFWQDMFVRDRKTGTTQRVSVGPGGVQANNGSYGAAISADGRFVAFQSEASNLVPGDTNGWSDVFLRDRQTGTTHRVSLGPGGVQANSGSGGAALSADGRFVAFDSGASKLVPGDTNGETDIFVRDRQTGTTERVNVSSGGAQSNAAALDPALSADGRFVAFVSSATNLVPGDTNDVYDVFLRDRQTGTTRRVSVGPDGAQSSGSSGVPAISADGRFVAFASVATNLVPGDTNGWSDLFLRDRQTGTTERVSISSGGAQGNFHNSDASALSADGRFVAFLSEATNLVPDDTNGAHDVFLRDRQTGTTRRVSVGPGGVQGNSTSFDPALSADGRFVAFDSFATNFVLGDTNDAYDVFVRILAP